MLPALGLCVGCTGLGWAPGWEVLREKLLLLPQLRWRRKREAGGRPGRGSVHCATQALAFRLPLPLPKGDLGSGGGSG